MRIKYNKLSKIVRVFYSNNFVQLHNILSGSITLVSGFKLIYISLIKSILGYIRMNLTHLIQFFHGLNYYVNQFVT